MAESPELAGVDFTSAPSRRKPIVAATGICERGVLRLDGFATFTTFEGYAQWLRRPGPWLGVFDLPFGLPRELVESLGWPTAWIDWLRLYAALPRADIRTRFAAFTASRPVGGKFAHRATDGPAGSSPSMKWVNPPVAYMLHAGVPLLVDAGVHLPAVHPGDPTRVALEGYPGLLARELIGRRSYKSDAAAGRTDARREARADLLAALERGVPRLGIRLAPTDAQRQLLRDDVMGDHVDAVLCLVKAAWAARQPGYGLPPGIDPLEGWIVGSDARIGDVRRRPAPPRVTVPSFPEPETTMPEDKIDIHQEEDVRQWAKKLDSTPMQIKEAVQAVGDRAAEVEMHLKGTRATTNSEKERAVERQIDKGERGA